MERGIFMDAATCVFLTMELLGTVAFALSGAMVAIERRTDVFGVLVLGVITATGGGMLRDILLGSLPPRLFTNQLYVALAAGTALILFLVARQFKEKYVARTALVNSVNNLFDAVGLGAFTVTGMQVGISSGYGSNVFLLVVVGVLTGVGGGLIRDLMVMQIPFILRKRIYALAAIAGALTYAGLWRLTGGVVLPAISAISVTVGLRLLATIFRWDLPRALD